MEKRLINRFRCGSITVKLANFLAVFFRKSTVISSKSENSCFHNSETKKAGVSGKASGEKGLSDDMDITRKEDTLRKEKIVQDCTSGKGKTVQKEEEMFCWSPQRSFQADTKPAERLTGRRILLLPQAAYSRGGKGEENENIHMFSGGKGKGAYHEL